MNSTTKGVLIGISVVLGVFVVLPLVITGVVLVANPNAIREMEAREASRRNAYQGVYQLNGAT